MTRVMIKTTSDQLQDFQEWDLHEMVSKIQQDMQVYFEDPILVRISWESGWVEKGSAEPYDSDRPRKDVLL